MTQTTPTTTLDPATTVGAVALTVADLTRSVAFYTDLIGLSVISQTAHDATLGVAGNPLLLLHEQPGATPWTPTTNGYTGLYHFAILLPTQRDLGRWLTHWLTQGQPLPGQGDHLVSEALYLNDPDGHGIEIYRDRPRDQWTWQNGRVQMATDPVDLRGLLLAAQADDAPWTGLPAGTTIGHIHLQVGDIPTAAAFYHDLIGFDIVAAMPSALFVSAGGYHHHLGMNTWHSRHATPAPSNSATMRHFTITLPTAVARQALLDRLAAAQIPYTQTGETITLQDPFHNTLHLAVANS